MEGKRPTSRGDFLPMPRCEQSGRHSIAAAVRSHFVVVLVPGGQRSHGVIAAPRTAAPAREHQCLAGLASDCLREKFPAFGRQRDTAGLAALGLPDIDPGAAGLERHVGSAQVRQLRVAAASQKRATDERAQIRWGCVQQALGLCRGQEALHRLAGQRSRSVGPKTAVIGASKKMFTDCSVRTVYPRRSSKGAGTLIGTLDFRPIYNDGGGRDYYVGGGLSIGRLHDLHEPSRWCLYRSSMRRSEILASDAATGELAQWRDASIGHSSATAPWRDTVRVEQFRQPTGHENLTTPLWDMVCICRSSGVTSEQRVGGEALRKFVVAPGQIYVYPAGQETYVRSTQGSECLVIQLEPRLLSAAARELGVSSGLTRFRSSKDSQIVQIGALLEGELYSGFSSGRLFGESLGAALSAHLMHHYSDRRSSNAQELNRGLPNKTLMTAIEYIQAHASENIGLESVADAVHVSPFHFCRLFKQSTGLTPYKYVIHFRIEEAKKLLRADNLSIAEIAQQVGFQHQSHFSEAFRKITGATPSQWRREPQVVGLSSFPAKNAGNG